MEAINKTAKAAWDAQMTALQAMEPQPVSLTQADPDGAPVDVGGGMICMPGDYYHKAEGDRDSTFVVAAADIGDNGAWQEVE